MRKITPVFLTVLILFCLSLTLVGCFSWQREGVRVMVSLDEGVSVRGKNPVDVRVGETVVFLVELEEGYIFKSCDGAVYDANAGTITIENVRKDTNVNFITEEYRGNGEKYSFFFKGADGDDSSIKSGSMALDSTYARLISNDTSKVFLGWSVGKSYSAGGTIISKDREYNLFLTEDMAVNGKIFVYANYVSADTVYYDLNGGRLDGKSENISAHKDSTSTPHYSVKVNSLGQLTVVYDKAYLEYLECASTFYDDGSFTKEGYVLKEYNTRPDGSGKAYSLGSKVPLISPSGEQPLLYCIWEKDTRHSDFTYESFSYPFPAGVNASKAPHWVENGVIITSYEGDDTTVTIPEKLDGKYVIAIKSGAFVNKSLQTLVLNRRILKIEDGAFKGCSHLTTIYYPDGLYSIGNDAFDEESYKSLKHLYVNATLAPRFTDGAETGAFATKLSRLLASEDKNRVIVIGGSSVFQGLGTEYMEALLDKNYRVINLGTTRTTNGLVYLEAMKELAHEGDIVIYAPENSAYMMGETELYWKTLRDLEGMINFYRHIDISNYTNVFASFSDLNVNYRYTRAPLFYEKVCEVPSKVNWTDSNGDCMYKNRNGYFSAANNYVDVYYISMNNRFKSRFDLNWSDPGQHDHADFTDPNDLTWCSVDDPYYKDPLNRAIRAVKAVGVKVYFGFCPTDADALVPSANSRDWLLAYDSFIAETYEFDGLVGSCIDYVLDHKYFYDCAFHPNNYGRTYRTYQLYLDLARMLGIEDTYGYSELGTSFAGCLFETGSTGEPLKSWEPENP